LAARRGCHQQPDDRNFLGIFDFTTNSAIFAPDKPRPARWASHDHRRRAQPGGERVHHRQHEPGAFYNDTAPGNGGLKLTTPAYLGRLAKASLLIRNVLGSPDIIGIQEIGHALDPDHTRRDISTDGSPPARPIRSTWPYLVRATTPSGINVGFSSARTASPPSTSPVRQGDHLHTPPGRQGERLNDRPPLVLHRHRHIPGYPAYPGRRSSATT